ncbi:MAG: PTS galactitol transporter subunit IIC [Spirochaetales bacterium]|nr:PTS galactitol transporter subunit IIC [Spirochaetales bacterium]
MMDFLTSVIHGFFEFEAYVMLPFFIFIIGLLVGMKVRHAFMAALKLGVGFAGVFIVFAYFVGIIQPAVASMVARWGFEFPVLDVGWVPLAAITWSSPVAPLSILLVMFVNILMLLLGVTKTIYIDIWNYWHFALIGALIFGTSENMFLALLSVLLIAVYTIKNGDWAAPFVKRETGLTGVTISPVSVVGLLPFAVTMEALYDRIPGFRRLKVNPSKNERSGSLSDFFSEPMIIGVLLGLLLGGFAGYPLKDILKTSINIAAVMFLLPVCAGLIARGITAVTGVLQETITRRFPRRKGLNVAVDTGILMESKSVILTGLLLMPLSLLLAFIVPGNKTLPLGDLPNLLSIMSLTVIVHRGNVLRSVITGIPVVATFMIIASRFAPLFTRLALETGNREMTALAAHQEITAFTDGGNHLRFLLFHLFNGNTVAMISIPVVIGMMVFTSWRAKKAAAEL